MLLTVLVAPTRAQIGGGASNVGGGTSTSSSGGVTPAQLIPGGSPTYLAKSCPSGATNCFVVNDDVQYAYSVTCNSNTTIVTGANDPPFVAGDVGKIIVGIQGAGTTANCPPQTTITGFTDAHTVTVANAATITGSSGQLGWGHNDGAQIAAAFAASLGVGCLYLPSGAMFFDVPPFLDTRSVGVAEGPVDCVLGSNTLLTPLQTFNYANCVSNGACVFTWPNAPFENPNYAVLKNFTILGIGSKGFALTGTGTTNSVLHLQRVSLDNVWVWHWGTSIGIGADMTGPMSAFNLNIDNTGSSSNCTANGTGGNQTITLYSPFCGEGGQALNVGAGAFLNSYGGQWGPGGAPNTIVNGNWTAYGDVIFAATSANADSIRVGAAGTAVLDSTQVIGGTGNTFGAINCNNSGGNVQLRGNTVIDGGSGGVAMKSVAGCNINNQSGGLAKVTRGTFSLSGNNIGQPSETQTGTCSGNAATVTFKYVYSQNPLVLVSDTTSASTGAQATSTNTTTATIHCNGATDTFVATVIPNPI